MTTDITELAPAMKAAAELITSGYSRKWIASHYDETCWVGANDDDGNLNPFIEVSITDWSGNKADNETLARFIALCRPANVLALVEALEKAQAQSSKWLEAYHKAVSIGARYEERIAELESRTVKLPEVRITIAEAKLRNLTPQQHDAYNAGASRAVAKISQELTAAGIKWEAE